jgi:hypothetical protein
LDGLAVFFCCLQPLLLGTSTCTGYLPVTGAPCTAEEVLHALVAHNRAWWSVRVPACLPGVVCKAVLQVLVGRRRGVSACLLLPAGAFHALMGCMGRCLLPAVACRTVAACADGMQGRMAACLLLHAGPRGMR